MKWSVPRFHVATIAVLTTVIGVPTLVSAEPFVSLYGGAAMPQPATVTTTVDQSSGLFSSGRQFTGSRQADFSSSFTVGGRIGYWIDRAPWFGIAFDLSYFPAHASVAQIDVIPFSFLVMSRVPLLTSEQFPKGRVRPYAGVGPSFVLANASTDFSPAVPPVDETSKSVGLDVRAGLDWLFTPHLSLFAEYRFFYTKVKADSSCEFICFAPFTTSTITTTLEVHTVSAGLSYHF
ncbi:MAG: outer membrane protein [Nitrospiraceae bacterium]